MQERLDIAVAVFVAVLVGGIVGVGVDGDVAAVW